MQPDESTSSSLLLVVRSHGNHEAWSRLLATYEPLLTRWLRSRGCARDRVPEVLSDVYLKLVQQLPSFIYDSNKSFRGWLKTVALNAAKDLGKRASNRLEHSAENALLESNWQAVVQSYEDRLLDDFADSVDARFADAKEVVERVRKRVSATTWDAFILTEVEGCSCSEAASKLCMSEGSVYVARFRVRKHLQVEAEKLNASTGLSS